MTIKIRKSPTADTRTCDFANTSQDVLLSSSIQHIEDVRQGIEFFRQQLAHASRVHDHDKLSDIEGFHRDFVTGFKQTTWWDNHRKVNRHHLLEADGVPADVNLIDVLDMIADCVMAGMARSGSVYALNIGTSVLIRAFDNTVELLKVQVEVEAVSEASKLVPQPTAQCVGYPACDGQLPGEPHEKECPLSEASTPAKKEE